jgi:Amt family ammonium transporter
LAELNGIGDPGLFYSGSFHQLLVQMLGIAASFTTVFVSSYLLFGLIKRTYGLRVSEEEERHGLDIAEHGMWGYPERFMPIPGSEYHPGEIAVHVDRARRKLPVPEGVS